jgi:hypothetical protein
MNDSSGVSAPVKGVLIVAATIAGVVILGFTIYVILRFLGIDVGAYTDRLRRRRRSSSNDTPSRGWGSRTPSFTFYSAEKAHRATRQLHKPIIIPTITARSPTPTQQQLDHADIERQDLVRNALKPYLPSLPFRSDPNHDPFKDGDGDGPTVYELPTQHPSSAFPSHLRRPSAATQDLRRVSYLSSLSSGFGDLKIDVPESGPSTLTKPSPVAVAEAHHTRQKSSPERISKINYQSRFSHSSWVSFLPSTPTAGGRSRANSRGTVTTNRDTIYTVTSEDNAPVRFRSVNSWVSQQARRTKRKRERERREEDVEREVGSMPELPRGAKDTAQQHQRQKSEPNSIFFGVHPGEEVPLGEPVRVKSEILDRVRIF